MQGLENQQIIILCCKSSTVLSNKNVIDSSADAACETIFLSLASEE